MGIETLTPKPLPVTTPTETSRNLYKGTGHLSHKRETVLVYRGTCEWKNGHAVPDVHGRIIVKCGNFYLRFRTTCRSHLQRSRNPKKSKKTS
jgi:ribosomal protein L24E